MEYTYNDLYALPFEKEGQPGRDNAEKDGEPWVTAEGIKIKGVYSTYDLEGMEHLGYAAGIPPFLRGPYFRNVCFSALDYQAVCRFLNCRGFKCFLQA